MATYEQTYCEVAKCPPSRFARRLFWAALPPGVRAVAPLLLALNPRFFAADLELIMAVARLKTSDELEEEIRDFRADPRNRRWSRRVLKLRVSTRRLRQLLEPA